MKSEEAAFMSLVKGALDQQPISGLTHNYYRYPARFSPQFAKSAILAFSRPGDLVLDPFMGGGTTILEAMISGRRSIGSDINRLSVFIAQTKVTLLSDREERAVRKWADRVPGSLKCTENERLLEWTPHNLTIPKARWLRKTISLLLSSADEDLPTTSTKRFARCVILNVGQWALNGRRRIPTAAEFRNQIPLATSEMLSAMVDLRVQVSQSEVPFYDPHLRDGDAETLHEDSIVNERGPVDLVVTSPPYPGIHMLYHRWQVDGRKETDAPYWIAGCEDGCGAAFYNFADRKKPAEGRYFEKAERVFSAIRRTMREGGHLVQMVAFSEPERQLSRYLRMMERAGFSEARESGQRRIWRDVPGRKWHAHYKGKLSSSREVLLVHQRS